MTSYHRAALPLEAPSCHRWDHDEATGRETRQRCERVGLRVSGYRVLGMGFGILSIGFFGGSDPEYCLLTVEYLPCLSAAAVIGPNNVLTPFHTFGWGEKKSGHVPAFA